MQTLKPVTKPSKQRKMLYNAPSHVRYRSFGAPLSPELRTSQKTKTLPVRRGDTVRVLRGDNKGFEGKINTIDRANYRIYIEGLTREKVDGTAIPVSVHPSKIMITNLNLDDKWRRRIVERKRELGKKRERVTEKSLKKAAETREKVTEEKISEKKAAEEEPREMKPRAKATLKRRRARAKAEKKEEFKEPTRKAEMKSKIRKPRKKRNLSSKKAEEEGGA